MNEGISPRGAAVVAGVSLLVMAVLSPVAFFYIMPRIVVRGDAVETTRNLVAHRGLFLAAIGCYCVTFLADVVAAWALYYFFRPVNASLSLLAACFRLFYAAVAMTTLLKLATVFRLAGQPTRDPAQLQLLLDSFRWEWGASMVPFAVYLCLIGFLAYVSRRVPRFIGALLVINGVAYAVDTLRPYLFAGTPLPYLPVAFFGELVFMVWLLARAERPSTRTT